MRKQFAQTIVNIAKKDKNMIFLTGDLGFMALEEIREILGERFINVGVAEQNMIGLAAGLASEGLNPICYSIAPFVVFRPAEQIRLDICLHDLNVKLIGNGGGYGYGIMGGTHHAIEDISVLSSFQNMTCYVPFCNEDVESVIGAMMSKKGPAYLRMGFGQKPPELFIPPYSAIRKITSGSLITLVAIGPVCLNAIKAIEDLNTGKIDIFVVSEMPLCELSEEFIKSLRTNRKLIILEEHVSRGGLAENICLLLAKLNIVNFKLKHLYAKGYPNGLYGSQKYHQEINKLDSNSITEEIMEFIYG